MNTLSGRICRHGHIHLQNCTQLVQIFVFEDVLWINYTTVKNPPCLTVEILFIGFSIRTFSSQSLGCHVLLLLIEMIQCSLRFCVHSELSWYGTLQPGCHHWYSIITDIPCPLPEPYTECMLAYSSFINIRGNSNNSFALWNTTTQTDAYKQTDLICSWLA